MKCATKHRRGFTLVELLMALAISGLVAAGVAGMLGGVAAGIAVVRDDSRHGQAGRDGNVSDSCCKANVCRLRCQRDVTRVG